jgi:hypothetical protein
VSTGATFTARGTSVPVNALAVVRAGVIESQAPDGQLIEHTVGVVAPLPDGPPALAWASVPPHSGTVGVADQLALGESVTGGYAPITWALDSGTLPAGLTLDTATGQVAGTPSAAGSSSCTVRATDSTRASAISQAVNFTVA